ncbi:hypothetical protein ABK040_014892 [Willaertia magna]
MYESHLSYIYKALASENKCFTKKDIINYIKTNYPNYNDFNHGITFIKDVAVTITKTDKGPRLYYFKIHSFNIIPNYNNETFIKVMNEYRNESMHRINAFVSCCNDINVLKENILMYYNNFNSRITSKEKVYVSLDLLNN